MQRSTIHNYAQSFCMYMYMYSYTHKTLKPTTDNKTNNAWLQARQNG